MDEEQTLKLVCAAMILPHLVATRTPEAAAEEALKYVECLISKIKP